MTIWGVFRAAWDRKGWIIAPVLVFSLAAGGIGLALRGRTTYVAGRVLVSAASTRARAAFACRSYEVLEKALERADVAWMETEELARAVKIELEGRDLVKLTVELGDPDLAEGLAGAICTEAVSATKASAKEEADEVSGTLAEMEYRISQLKANLRNAQAELDELVRKHPAELDSGGLPLGSARRMTAELAGALRRARVDLAAAEAEIPALRRRIEVTPELRAGRVRVREEGPRFAALEGELARLRKDLTDEHPSVAALLAEKARAEIELALASDPTEPNPTRLEIERTLLSRETAAESAKARIAELGKELESAQVDLRASLEWAEAARRLRDRVAATEAQVSLEEEKQRRAELAFFESRPPEEPLKTRERLERESRPSGFSPVWLAVVGAVIGLFVGAGLATAAESLDPVMRTPLDVEDRLGLPVLAAIPRGALGLQQARSGRKFALFLWIVVILALAAFAVVLFYPKKGARPSPGLRRAPSEASAEEGARDGSGPAKGRGSGSLVK